MSIPEPDQTGPNSQHIFASLLGPPKHLEKSEIGFTPCRIYRYRYGTS
jgi:hypothetical protein